MMGLFVSSLHTKTKAMYKAFKNKKYYLAFNRFNIERKTLSDVYLTGFHKWEADDSTNYSIVIGRCRVILGFNKLQITCSG